MKVSKWRQDCKVWSLASRDTLEQALTAVGAVAEALGSDFDFTNAGRDAEYCLILRTDDETRIITCGTDSATNYSAETFGNRLKRKSRFERVNYSSHDDEIVVEWLKNVGPVSEHHAMWDREALENVVRDARGFGGSNVELCLVLRNWYLTRIVTCGVTKEAADGARALGWALKNTFSDAPSTWNPARTKDSH